MKFLKVFIITVLILVATIAGAALKIAELIRIEPDFPIRPLNPPVITSGDMPSLPQNQTQTQTQLQAQESLRLKTDPLLGTTNVLLVGLDNLESVYRADAIALAFFDLKGEAVGILSIPRDSRVQIPGRGWEKINHAYVYGGASLLRRTIENLTNITINYHVVFNFDNFPRMIDLLGGVDIYVDRPMRYNDFSQKLFINIPQGQQHLDGTKSLHYVRFRNDPLGDLGRVERQQKFMVAALDKVKSPFIIPQIPSLVREVISSINTDFTPLEAAGLALFSSTLKRERANFAMAPGKASYIGGISYWVIDPVEMSVLIPRLIAGEEIPEPAVQEATPAPPPDLNSLIARIGKISVLNGDGTTGLARRGAQVFQSVGIDVSFTGDARHFGYEASSVIYPSEQYRQAAEALAQLCGITNMALVRRDTSARMVSIILGSDKETIFSRLTSSN